MFWSVSSLVLSVDSSRPKGSLGGLRQCEKRRDHVDANSQNKAVRCVSEYRLLVQFSRLFWHPVGCSLDRWFAVATAYEIDQKQGRAMPGDLSAKDRSV